MNRFIVIISVLFSIGCNSETAPDCLKRTGSIISKEIELDDFNGLLINNEFNVILSQGNEQEIILSAGENLINDITFTVNDDLLEIANNISCRWTRDYNFPTLEITHPDLRTVEIIGGSIITSNGILTYPDMSFKSEDSNGNIRLSVNMENLVIDSNEITNYWVDGSVNNLNLIYSSGNGRFEGAELEVINARVRHNGSNDIIINASESLTGSINSTGDLIYVGQTPAVIEIELTNRGKLVDGTR